MYPQIPWELVADSLRSDLCNHSSRSVYKLSVELLHRKCPRTRRGLRAIQHGDQGDDEKKKR
jgi:hypothetical protein